MEKLYNRKEAAAILGISIASLDNARYAGIISYIQYVPNGSVFFTEEAIQDEAIFKKVIIDSGYDGAISGTQRELYKIPSNATKAREIVVVNPNQIKSATDNIGTFSTTNNDIRYSSVTEQPIKVPSVTSFAERLSAQQQSKFASLVARGEISTSCR